MSDWEESPEDQVDKEFRMTEEDNDIVFEDMYTEQFEFNAADVELIDIIRAPVAASSSSSTIFINSSSSSGPSLQNEKERKPKVESVVSGEDASLASTVDDEPSSPSTALVPFLPSSSSSDFEMEVSSSNNNQEGDDSDNTVANSEHSYAANPPMFVAIDMGTNQPVFFSLLDSGIEVNAVNQTEIPESAVQLLMNYPGVPSKMILNPVVPAVESAAASSTPVPLDDFMNHNNNTMSAVPSPLSVAVDEAVQRQQPSPSPSTSCSSSCSSSSDSSYSSSSNSRKRNRMNSLEADYPYLAPNPPSKKVKNEAPKKRKRIQTDHRRAIVNKSLHKHRIKVKTEDDMETAEERVMSAEYQQLQEDILGIDASYRFNVFVPSEMSDELKEMMKRGRRERRPPAKTKEEKLARKREKNNLSQTKIQKKKKYDRKVRRERIAFLRAEVDALRRVLEDFQTGYFLDGSADEILDLLEAIDFASLDHEAVAPAAAVGPSMPVIAVPIQQEQQVSSSSSSPSSPSTFSGGLSSFLQHHGILQEPNPEEAIDSFQAITDLINEAGDFLQ